MALKFTTSYIEDALSLFEYYKKLAEKAMDQVADEQLTTVLDDEMNSIALIVKHMAGNMRSRWSDFLVSDGEKTWRNRDEEFSHPPETRTAILEHWESGWAALFDALRPLTDEDLKRVVTIRGEAHSVMQTINRQLAHYPYHCGQIVFLAKHLCKEQWMTLSVAKGASADFNRNVATGKASQR